MLTKLVQSGWNNWGQIADKITGRTSKQCRERWFHHLDPSIKRGDYTSAEDDLILDLHDKLGNKWSQIAAQLEGRTEDAVKIRWKTLNRHRRQGKPVGNTANRMAGASDPIRPKVSTTCNSEEGVKEQANCGRSTSCPGLFSQQLELTDKRPTVGESVVSNIKIEGASSAGMLVNRLIMTKNNAQDKESSSTPSAVSSATSTSSNASSTTRIEANDSKVPSAVQCATTSAVAEALGNLSPSKIIMSNNASAEQKALNNLSRGYSMEWLENCLKSLESRELGSSRTSTSRTSTSSGAGNHTNSIMATGSLFDSIGDRDGFDRLVLSLLREGKEYVQVKQHLQIQFGRPLTDAEKARVTQVTKTADHVGMPPTNSQTNSQKHHQSGSHRPQDATLRLSGTGLAGLDLDLFDSKCGELDMRLSTGSTGSLGSMIGGIGMSMEEHCNNSVAGKNSIANDESTGHTTTAKQPHVGVLSPCRDSMERNSFSMDAMRASLTATANIMP